MSLLSEHNRNVILLDTYGKPITYLNPARESVTATQYRMAQYDAFRDKSKREYLARQIISLLMSILENKQSPTNHNLHHYLDISKHSTNLGMKRGDSIFIDFQ